MLNSLPLLAGAKASQGRPRALTTCVAPLVMGLSLINSYRRAYELTFLIQGWSQSDRRRLGSAVSRFQAVQQASTMAR